MTRITWISAFILISLGCQANAPRQVDADDVNREATEAIGTAEQYASQEASEFVAESKKTIAQLEKQAAVWRAETQDLGEEARAASRKELAELEAKATEASKHLETFKGDSQMAWTEFKQGAESAMDELHKAYDRAARRFNDEA